MAFDRVGRIIDRMDMGDDAADTLDGLCFECARELDVSGASIVLFGDSHDAALASSGATAVALARLQVAWGQGPSVDACRIGRPVYEPDLAAWQRWPVFAAVALARGARAVFAVPLLAGSERLGTFELHRSTAGGLSAADDADVQSIAGLLVVLAVLMRGT